MNRRAFARHLVAVALASGCRRREESPEVQASAPTDYPMTLEDYDFGGDFTLTDHHATPFSLTQLRGKFVLVFFGYTLCPDVCPMTMSKITRAFEILGPAKTQVETLFISVDVDRDTPAVLADYVKAFDVPVTGLTGTREEVDAVVGRYNAAYEIVPSASAGGPTVTHTTYTYLVDRRGKLRHLFRHNDTAETIAKMVQIAIAADPQASS
ncbi:MAG: SCO family protein [Vicinamibacterales bacterium]